MLLNIDEIKISVKSDGKINTTTVSTDKQNKLSDVMTAIELAKDNYTNAFMEFMQKNHCGKDLTEPEVEKIFRDVTIKDLNI